MIADQRTYYKKLTAIMQIPAEEQDGKGCGVRYFCRWHVHNGQCTYPYCNKIHSNPPAEKKNLVQKPGQNTSRRGTAAQWTEDSSWQADSWSEAGNAGAIIDDEPTENFTLRRDQLLADVAGVSAPTSAGAVRA